MFHVVDYSVHLCGLGCNETASAAKLIILYEILCECVCVCMQACVCACVMNQKWAFCWVHWKKNSYCVAKKQLDSGD